MNSINFIEEEYKWKNISLMEYLNEGNIPSSWKEFFDREDIQSDLNQISNVLEKESLNKTIYPLIYQVFRVFYTTQLEKIEVVILGMDPYINGSAVGLSFAVRPGNSINPSLQNIYKELKNEGYTPNENGDLSNWVEQGVFLLNTALTVEKGRSDSHTKLWYNFSTKLIKYISQKVDVEWFLFGNKAQAFEKYIDQGNVYKTTHPSPLSAYKSTKDAQAFLGSGIFKSVDYKIKW